jgi:fructokinase
MAQLDPAGGATYRFQFEGTSAPSLTPELAQAALPEGPAALHVGSLGLVLEPMAQALESLVERLAGRVPVMVDPNVRPALIGDPAAYRARLDRVIAHADIVKVSDEDLAVLDPDRPAPLAARRLLAKGPRLVLLTLGAQGAMAFGSFGARTADAPKVAVVDTIGAGDTFSGAWLARWLDLGRPVGDGERVLEATAFACRAAALSCTRAGAQPPTWAELQAAS